MMNKAPALVEGMKILELVAAADGAVSFQKIEESSEMSRASVTRLLKVLSDSAYLEPGRNLRDGYTLGTKFLYLLNMAKNKLNVLEVIKDKLHKLAVAIDCSLQYAVYDRCAPSISVVCKAECEASPSLGGPGYNLITGSHRHALGRVIMAFVPPQELERIMDINVPRQNTEHTIMPGKALDAELLKIREQHMAFENQECRPGIQRAAVPLFDSKNRIYAGLCASWFDVNFSERKARKKAEELRATAESIEQVI